MLINIPKNYKRTHGSLDDPICYLTGRDSSSFPIWNVLRLKSSLLDHPETFIDRVTKERIFVSHPYSTMLIQTSWVKCDPYWAFAELI